MPNRLSQPWLPFVVPYALYVLLTSFDNALPGKYPIVYAIKLAVVIAAAWFFRPATLATYVPQGGRLSAKAIVAGVVGGAVLTAVWVGVDPHTPHFALLGSRVGFDPYAKIHDPALRAAFLAVRFLGLVLVVPWTEELFFRGFLLRYVSHPVDWDKKSPEQFTAGALLVNVLLFAAIHPEWLVAAIFAGSMVGLLAWTKDVRACMVAHAVCNLLLGISVLETGAWQYW